MPIMIPNIRLEIGRLEEEACETAFRLLGIPRDQVVEAYIWKSSLDARRHGDIHWVCSVCFELAGGEEELARRLGVPYRPQKAFQVTFGARKMESRPVVAGFGPAGMFSALLLAQNGYRPLILERGGDTDSRVEAVEGFWKGGPLLEGNNVQFWEGGAGTFSDGKLTTRIHDPRCRLVLETFVRHGAPKEILRRAKPHVGTDKLRGVMKSIREEILRCGGEIRFHTQVESVTVENGRLKGIRAAGTDIAAETLVLAIGHSARDTFSMLQDKGIPMEAKAFSVGVRIEHLQEEINRGLYHGYSGKAQLPPGEYQLSHRTQKGACYTFCMCPGGVVVPAASQEGGVVTNGMSVFARDGKNANSAVVVGVDTGDFGGTDPLAGTVFQRELERKAFSIGGGGYRAPAQDVAGFLAGKQSCNVSRVLPTYARGVTAADFSAFFPPRIAGLLREGIIRFGRQLPGFDAPYAILTGVESRTSSPVRILRGEAMESTGAEGIFPCGEGAGYAGGITSAAVDGMRAAQEIMGRYAPG